MLFYGWWYARASCINGKSRAELPATYEASCPPLNDMIFNYVRQFAGVVFMTGSEILDWYNAVA